MCWNLLQQKEDDILCLKYRIVNVTLASYKSTMSPPGAEGT